jgi:hypothetical protein
MLSYIFFNSYTETHKCAITCLLWEFFFTCGAHFAVVSVRLDNSALPFMKVKTPTGRLRSRIEVPRTLTQTENKNIMQHISFLLEFSNETPH